jgi:hypothetical protein
MSRRPLLFVVALATIVVTALITYGYHTHITPNSGETFALDYKPGISYEADSAINQAKQIYLTKKQTGEDLSNGPCLTNALMPGWVLDLVHDPREPVDDLSENQCSAYLQGQAMHFIELDLEGNLVRFR